MRQVLQSSEEATLERDRIQETFSRGWAQSSTIAEEGESNVANISARGRNGRSRSRASSVESATPRWNHVKEAAEETREREMLIRMELAMESARSLNVDLSVLGMNEQGVEEGLPTAGNPTDVSLVVCASQLETYTSCVIRRTKKESSIRLNGIAVRSIRCSSSPSTNSTRYSTSSSRK